MKKTLILLSAFAILANVFTSCKKEEPVPTGEKVTFADALAATDAFYTTWDNERVIPAEVKVGTKTLSISEFLYMEATLINNIKAASTADITVVSYKAASNPDRDSYDKEEIAVVNGPADGSGITEDITTIASRIIASAKEKGQIPNQTIITRGTNSLAFCTDRAIVTIARAVSKYADSGELSGKVSTEYKALAATLKSFATEFVKYLDKWDATVCGKLSADGKRCEDNGTALENVHFVPIPQDQKNDWKNQGEQWDDKYKPYLTVTVNGTTYTAANCWEIAIRGLMDLCTSEGSDFLTNMDSRNKKYTLANGKSLNSAPIRTPSENCIWGKYPWYEVDSDNDLVTYNGKEIKEVGIEFILKCGSWHVVRGLIKNSGNTPLGCIGNFQQFGTNEASTLVLDGYQGLISPMREFLILARIYKYILDNDINANVYDAIKDQKFDFDLYKQEAVPVVITTTKVEFDAKPAEGKPAEFTTTDAWTASSEESWIHFTPTSGAAGAQTITVTVDENTETTKKTGTIKIAVGEYSKTIAVEQAAKEVTTDATIKEFLTEFVKVLDTWKTTTGTINQLTGEAKGDAQYDIENAHYIPDATTITVKGKTYNTADMYETALRCYLLLRGWDGNWTGGYGPTNYTEAQKLSGSTVSGTTVPTTHAYPWGPSPYNETGSTSAGSVVVGNGGPVKMGDPATADGVDSVKVDILDNFAMRSANWPITQTSISNMCGYNNRLAGYYGCFCAKRAIITYAIFFKYMLDNKLETATDIPATQTFLTDLYGNSLTTIKEFATEYVKLLDVWSTTKGTVEKSDSTFVDFNRTNVNYIPFDATITVKGNKYGISQCLEIAMRSFMLLMGKDGNSTTLKGNGNFPDIKKSTMNSPMPDQHNYKYQYWYNETESNGGPIRWEKVAGTKLKNTIYSKMLLNFSERNINFVWGNNMKWSNVSAYPRKDYITDCSGTMVPGRAQMAFLNLFKMLLDNNVTENVDTYLADKDIDCTLWNNETYD